jgi:hypothetical protein
VAAPVAEPELTWTLGSLASLDWTPGAGAAFYNLYRGTPADLVALTDASADSCLRATTAEPTTGETLSELPPDGSFYWYLVRAGNAGGEGPAGDTSAGPRVQDSQGACP